MNGHFRLNRVLDVKRIEEKRQAKTVADAERRLRSGEAVLKSMKSEAATFRAAIARDEQSGVMEAGQLSHRREYYAQLIANVDDQRSNLEIERAKLDRERDRLVRCMQERRMLETLEEKADQESRSNAARREQHAVDEAAIRVSVAADGIGDRREEGSMNWESERGSAMTSALLFVGGAIGLFLVSVPVFLYFHGMISLTAPHLRAAKVYSVAAAQVIERRGAEIEAAVEAAKAEESGVKPAAAAQEAVPPREPAEQDDADAAVDAVDASVMSAASEGPQPPAEGLEGTPFEGEKLSRLVRVYEKMRPKQVGLILSTMSERHASVILSRMKEKSAAGILAEMDPAKAARMSELLARKKDA